MIDRSVTLRQGPHQGWTVQRTDVPWQFQVISQTLTAHHPPQLPGLGNLRIGLSLTIRPPDPQWELLNAADLDRREPAYAAALLPVLTRIHTAVGTAADWQTNRASSGWDQTLTASAHNIAGVGTTVSIRAFVPSSLNAPDAQAYRAWDQLSAARYGPDARLAALNWVLRQVPALPGMPAPGGDWAAQTAAALRQHQPSRPRVGEIVVTFTNAINGRQQQRRFTDLAAALQVADTHQPFNNTRVSAHRWVAGVGGAPVREELPLASRPRQAAQAFPAMDIVQPRPARALHGEGPTSSVSSAAFRRPGPGNPPSSSR